MIPVVIWPYLMGGDAAAPISAFNIGAQSILVTSATSSEQATASLFMNSNGTITATNTNLGSGAWHSNPADGLGVSYWVIVNITSGAVSTGTTGSRVQLTSGTGWTAVTAGTASLRRKYIVGTFEIWDAATLGNMVSSGTFTMDAQVEAASSVTGGSDPYDDGLGDTRLDK